MLRLCQIPDQQNNHRHQQLLMRGIGGRNLSKAELQQELEGVKVHHSGFANARKQEHKEPGEEGQFRQSLVLKHLKLNFQLIQSKEVMKLQQ